MLPESSVHPEHYYFNEFKFDVRRRALLKDGKVLPLSAKLLSLLLVLLRNQGLELSKDYLMNAVWPDSRVEGSNLTQSIFLLRRLLGNKSDGRELILTIPGKGYLFTGIVKPEGDLQLPTGSHFPGTSGLISKRPSIAVLPFQVLDYTQESQGARYLGIGIADALVTRLSHIDQFDMRPTTTIRDFLGDHRDFQEVGRTLGVNFLIVGVVHVEPRRTLRNKPIRVTVQLLNVYSGSLVWSDSVDDQLSHILALHDKLAATIGHAIAKNLTVREQAQLVKRYTDDNAAYQDYLKGRYYAAQYTIRGWSKAISCFSKAVQKDPDYALAYSGMSDAHYMAANIYSAPMDVMPKAQMAADRALKLNNELAETHTSVALVKGFYEWNWVDAEASFRRAILLNERCADAHLWYGRLLTTGGRFTEAIDELKHSQRLDPLSAATNAELGRTLYYARRYQEAKEQLRETLELNPNFWPAHLFLGWVYEQQGHSAEAIAILHRSHKLDDNPRTVASLATAYAIAGEEAQAERLLLSLKEQSKRCYVSADYIATIYTALGDLDRAFRYFAKAYDDRSGWLVWLGVDPHFDSLRHDPRFKNLINKVGVPISTSDASRHSRRISEVPLRTIDFDAASNRKA